MKKDMFINIIREAYESGCSAQIPYTMKNGEIVDKEFFHLLSNLQDDDPITIVSKTEDQLVLEIQNKGLENLLKTFYNP
jgi:hypothetical protein